VPQGKATIPWAVLPCAWVLGFAMALDRA
jgi:hypothetical protein